MSVLPHARRLAAGLLILVASAAEGLAEEGDALGEPAQPPLASSPSGKLEVLWQKDLGG